MRETLKPKKDKINKPHKKIRYANLHALPISFTNPDHTRLEVTESALVLASKTVIFVIVIVLIFL